MKSISLTRDQAHTLATQLQDDEIIQQKRLGELKTELSQEDDEFEQKVLRILIKRREERLEHIAAIRLALSSITNA